MQTDYEKGYKIDEGEAGIIYLTFTRGSKAVEDSTTIANAIHDTIDTIFEKYGENEALLLVQLVDDDGIVSQEAKSIYKKLIKDPRIMRMAIFGGLGKYRRIARLLLKVTVGDTVNVFDSKGEAMQWLIQS